MLLWVDDVVRWCCVDCDNVCMNIDIFFVWLYYYGSDFFEGLVCVCNVGVIVWEIGVLEDGINLLIMLGVLSNEFGYLEEVCWVLEQVVVWIDLLYVEGVLFSILLLLVEVQDELGFIEFVLVMLCCFIVLVESFGDFMVLIVGCYWFVCFQYFNWLLGDVVVMV